MRGRRTTRAPGGAALGLFAALATAATATAQVDVSGREGELSVRGRSAWPTGVSKGYAPLTLEIENSGENSCVVDVELTNEIWRGYSGRVLDAVVVGPGETVVRELLVPCFNAYHDSWRGEIRSSRRERIDFHFNGYGSRGGQRVHHLVVARPAGASGAAPDAWAESLKTADVEPSTHVRVTKSVSGPQPNARLGTAAFDELPQRHEAYSSLDAVVVDGTREGLPDETRLGPLLRWARQGGVLVVVGRPAVQQAQQHPALGPWLEPRFELDRLGTAAAYSFGLGKLIVDESDALLSDDVAALVRAALEQWLSWVPSPFGSKAAFPTLEIPGLSELPFRALTLFLVLFALLIGPANFAVARKLGRSYVTLYTIPALSAVACLFLLGYAFLSQGIDVKAAVETYALLDQRTHQVDTAEVRLFYAGLSPGRGLVPAAGSACYPDYVPQDAVRDLGPQYRVEMQEGLLFAGEYLPTRSLTRQCLVTGRTARGRLELEPGEGATQAHSTRLHNGLGGGIEELLLRDAGGSYWSLASPVDDGGQGELTPLGPAAAEAWLADFTGGVALLGSSDRLPPAVYAARLSASPFRDDFGIELNELEATHRVVGVLDPGRRRSEKPALEVRGLTKRFGSLVAVDDVSFAVHPGEIYGFIGPNGAGKTTTMRIVATLDLPDTGDVFVDGHSVLEEPRRARDRLGFMPDAYGAYANTTVRDYLDFYGRAYGLSASDRRSRISYLMDFTALEPLAQKQMSALSKGMKQRLCLAKTLLHDPTTLVLDEPAAGLDPRARIELRELVRALADMQKAVLISSHILAELSEMCGGVAVIEQGRIRATGSVEEIVRGLQVVNEVYVRTLAGPEATERALLEEPHVERVRRERGGVVFDFAGGTDELAGLLATLVQRGLQPIEFSPVETDLEDVFLSLTEGIVQ